MRLSGIEPAPVRQGPSPSALRPAELPDTSASQRGSEYAQLSRQIKQAGLLEPRPGYYIWKIAATAVLLIGGWVVFVLVGNSWWQLAVAAFQGILFTQVGFLGHDAGHRQIFGSRRANYVLGILLGLTTAVVLGPDCSSNAPPPEPLAGQLLTSPTPALVQQAEALADHLACVAEAPGGDASVNEASKYSVRLTLRVGIGKLFLSTSLALAGLAIIDLGHYKRASLAGTAN